MHISTNPVCTFSYNERTNMATKRMFENLVYPPRYRLKMDIFLFTTAPRTALGPTQPPIQWVSGALSLGIKRPKREADHSPPLPNMLSWRSARLQHRDNFTFIFYVSYAANVNG
jgi:hypothetical protein